MEELSVPCREDSFKPFERFKSYDNPHAVDVRPKTIHFPLSSWQKEKNRYEEKKCPKGAHYPE